MQQAGSFLRPDWPAPARVQAACTSRIGGSEGPYASFNLALHVGDDPQRVLANRRYLRDRLQLPAEPAWLDQVHGTRVLALPPGDAPRTADAACTAQPGQVCAVMTADCLPVLFCDDAGSCVAAAHAGWRGLADGVLEAAVAALPAAPRKLMAWLGPAIGPQHFEVGAEVRERFVAQAAQAAGAFRDGAPGKYYADLYALARQRLAAAGVGRVFGGRWCTYGEPERFFSFRREGRCGRMASLIWLRP